MGSCLPDVRGTWDYYPITSFSASNVVYSYSSYTYNYALYSTNVTYVTNTYDHVFTGGDYVASSISGSSIFEGTTRLVLTSGLNMQSGDGITIANGGSLTLYSGGTTATIGGNGVANNAGYAADFIMYCAPTVTAFNFNGNGNFIGVLCAPEANCTMNGGGSSQNFEGSIVMNSIRMNGHYSFHYDEALARTVLNGRLLVATWDEIDPHTFH